jgi:hypothetical protein
MELHSQYVGRHLQVSRQGLGKNGVSWVDERVAVGTNSCSKQLRLGLPCASGDIARLSGWQPVGNWVASAENFPASLLPVGVTPTSRRIATRSLRRKKPSGAVTRPSHGKAAIPLSDRPKKVRNQNSAGR